MSRDILVAGETLIDWVPERSGPLEDVAGFERRPGGAPANVAVALARLGEPPLFWTRVGADPFGRYLERTLADHEIPDRFVERDPAAKTTLAFVTHDEGGEREFTFYRDGTADTRLEPGRIDDATLSDWEWVHAGGVTLSSGSAREATLDLLERAAAADCTVSFDPNLRSELWPDEETFATVVGEALAHVDICLATGPELAALGYDGDSPTALARAAVERGPVHTAVVTRGAAGAVAVASADAPWGEAAVEHPGFAVETVDTTGAGDAFVAGAIAALRDGDDLEAAITVANAVGARATTAAGGMTALPTRAEVAALLEAE
ncbi:PfkB domain protein [Natrinema pellirubrum DSM 15624]|uniref:PfkB domain protein n=1 Tax=Natrinema pellirubrum (strain DSM 15624 / CIP 106293 / JCM 10476 / NCIMB 786 / 157) TaxID=797303 RepID=L0JL43_NATP1|nr:carbohydrate kinase [Natrinema pellirubrum]AGB32250.1 sugar kinase, ribokinase [Natrinema pellirubrum DSM 15624]ELY74683.1 PfkB domain protein [Natrinema pellirubrum DSM 15624]